MTKSEAIEQAAKERINGQRKAAESAISASQYANDIGFQVYATGYGLRPIQKPGSTLTAEEFQAVLQSLNLQEETVS